MLLVFENFDENLVVVSLSTLISYERRSVSDHVLLSNIVSFLVSLSCNFSNQENMAWIVVSRTYLFKIGEVEVEAMVSSVEIIMFSVESDCVLVEGDIIRNKVFVGI